MSTTKQKLQKLSKSKSKISQEFSTAGESHIPDEDTDDDSVEKIFQHDPDIFLLNNILMSVQFFENYERDVRLLREDWFKETTLSAHHKKCFYADSLFRLSAANVKFAPRQGINKNSETSLHPLRIYISSDNIEAAFDPSSLRRSKSTRCPQYQFTVKTTEKNRKSGCVQLIDYKATKASDDDSKADFPINRESPTSTEQQQQQQNYIQLRRKSNFDTKPMRRLTKTEKLIGSQNHLRLTEKRGSLKFFAGATDVTLSQADSYKLTNAETRVKPMPIQEFRMNSGLLTSCDIPLPCFQIQDVKQPLNGNRRIGIMKNKRNSVFRTQYVLNSAAFKGYFCDLLIERLAGTLPVDSAAINNSFVLGEFVTVNQSGMQYGITPVIPIRDWNNFIVISERLKGRERMKELSWPSGYMQKIINILPCNAVPVGHSTVSEENPDYEKEWTLVFPKTEEFLLLHMMHAHVRCYFFALLIYKSFLETEVNAGSFGPKHLLHLLFWRVRKNFLAWPEDRPGETLLIYLKALYKKLQNKCLRDFFVNSRNLFATSLPNDLHKAQALIKKVIENPIPSVIRALGNLRLRPSFYPSLDFLKLHAVLTAPNTAEKPRKVKKEKRQKTVRFDGVGDAEDEDDDDERQWKKNVIRQIELERKMDKEAAKLSAESIHVDEQLNFDIENQKKCHQVLEILFSHFLKMRHKSLEFKFSSQALSYFSHAKKLLDLMASKGGYQNDIRALKTKLNKLTESGTIPKHDPPKTLLGGQRLQVPVLELGHTRQNDVRKSTTESEEDTVKATLTTVNRKNEPEGNNHNRDSSDEEILESKL